MELILSHELWLTWFAELLLFFGCCWMIGCSILTQKEDLLGPWVIALGWCFITVAITYRWIRTGHGPFITMYEILLSNLWSLLTIWLYVFWKNNSLRPVLIFVLPIFFLMMGWLLMSRPGEFFFPPTYQTVWLYIHVLLGKVFFGALLIALSLSIVVLLSPLFNEDFNKKIPSFEKIEVTMTNLLLLALIFDSLMLVAGGIWAQQAWGRFWAWDSLESWSFICWLSIGLLLHIRVAWKLPIKLYALATIVIFCIAFVTFYGVPFVSQAPHQGVI